jgi:hypothetical protein
MAKTLLSLMLMLTQLLSWSTPSVYLCVDSEGTIRLDGGPNSCDGCHHDSHDDHDEALHECSHHKCSAGHDYGLASRCSSEACSADAPQLWTLADADCDCLHFQIVSQQQPTTVRAAASIDSAQQNLVAPLADILSMTQPTSSQVESAGGPFRAASSFALIERASVCLRC